MEVGECWKVCIAHLLGFRERISVFDKVDEEIS